MNLGPVAPADLPRLAAEAHAASGLSQRQAALQLEVSPQIYGAALREGGSLDALRRRIVETFTDYRVVERPPYEVVRKVH